MRKTRIRVSINWISFAGAWLLFTCSHEVVSQDLYNSPYSVFGPGIVHERSSALNRGMAGVGIGIHDTQDLNHANPASYAAIQFPITHIFEGGGYLESNRYETNRLTESRWKGGFSNLSYWFRIRPWYGSSLGISPYSSVAYNIATEKQIAIGEEGTYIFEGSGNITRLFWGNGFKLTKNLYAGVTFSYLFGSIKRDETVLSALSGNILTLERKTFSNKFTADFGLQYKMNLMSRTLTVGAIYNGGLTLPGKNSYMLTDLGYDTLADFNGEKVSYRLPEKFGAGLSLGSKRSLIASDLTFARWSEASYEDEAVAFRDSWKMSLGYVWRGNEFAESYFGIIGFRAGLYYQEHYLVVKKTPLTNWGGSVCVSLPVADGKSLINISYAYDRMGTLENNLILHTVEKIQIDFVIRDIWGQKRRFE